MNKNFSKLLILIGVFILIYILYKFGFGEYLSLKNLKERSFYLRSWVQGNYIFSVSVYMIVYFLIITCSIPAVAPLTLMGGFLFGTFYGVFYSLFAATAGALVAFLLFRSVLRDTVSQKYSKQLTAFKSGLKEYGAFYLLVLHFMIVIPFVVINVLAALADVSLRRFTWTTAVGFLPCAVLYAFGGNQITKIQSVGDLFSFNVIIALMFLILLTLMPVIFKTVKRSVGI